MVTMQRPPSLLADEDLDSAHGAGLTMFQAEGKPVRAKTHGVVLQFDEADALFGKRTEVQDRHDSYANLETSYLKDG